MMLKVLLKEPVSGIVKNGRAARSGVYVLVRGELNTKTEKIVTNSIKNGDCITFVLSDGYRKVLVPAGNISYIMEADDARRDGSSSG